MICSIKDGEFDLPKPVILKLQSATLVALKGPERTADSRVSLSNNVRLHHSGCVAGRDSNFTFELLDCFLKLKIYSHIIMQKSPAAEGKNGFRRASLTLTSGSVCSCYYFFLLLSH